MASKVHWGAFYSFVGVWFTGTTLVVDEELGILHKFGLQPITIDSLSNPLLFFSILLLGPTFAAWWAVHVYRRKWGDLAAKTKRDYPK